MSIDLDGYISQERKIKNKELRAVLMKKDPHCYWCGAELDDSPQAHSANLQKGEIAPDNMATIEHLFDRLQVEMRYKNTENKYKVLACYRCNHRRGKELARNERELVRIKSVIMQKRPKGISRPLFFLQNL